MAEARRADSGELPNMLHRPGPAFRGGKPLRLPTRQRRRFLFVSDPRCRRLRRFRPVFCAASSGLHPASARDADLVPLPGPWAEPEGRIIVLPRLSDGRFRTPAFLWAGDHDSCYGLSRGQVRFSGRIPIFGGCRCACRRHRRSRPGSASLTPRFPPGVPFFRHS